MELLTVLIATHIIETNLPERSFFLFFQILEEHHRLLDRSVSARLNWDFANRWMGIRLDLIGAVIISSAAFSVGK